MHNGELSIGSNVLASNKPQLEMLIYLWRKNINNSILPIHVFNPIVNELILEVIDIRLLHGGTFC